VSLLRAVIGGTQALSRRHDDGNIPSVEGWGDPASGRISQDEAVRILAIHSCVSLLSDVISTFPAGAFDRNGPARVPVADPDWLSVPIPSDPNETWEDHVSMLVWSQELDGNSFTLALPDVYDPAEIYVVNPRRVTIRKRGVFELALERGREVVGPDQLIHISRNRRPGELRGMSPIEEAGASFAMKRAADRFTARVFNQGIFLTGQMVLPGPAAKDVIDQVRDELVAQYGGAANAGKPGVFANGAEWKVPRLNLQEMQLAELHKFAKLEAAGLFRVPPYLIGVVEPGAMAYASVEALGTDFEKYSVSTRVIRIEKGYNRMIPGRTSFLKLSTAGLLRGSLKERMEAHQVSVQSRLQRVDEIRALEDWAPFGDDAGGGFLATPNNSAPDPRYQEAAVLVRAGFDPAAALAAVGLEPISHTGLVPITVQPLEQM
jgi:HK97 family phage portal protein